MLLDSGLKQNVKAALAFDWWSFFRFSRECPFAKFQGLSIKPNSRNRGALMINGLLGNPAIHHGFRF